MKQYTLLRKVLAPMLVISLLVAITAFFYVFHHNLRTIEYKANDELVKLNNLLITSHTLVGEHVISSISLLQQLALSDGSPEIKGKVNIGGNSIPALFFGRHPQTGDTHFVDQVARIGHCSATIFVRDGNHFVRIATNVKKADGSSGFGTLLDPTGKAISQLQQGRAFYGVVDVLGKLYISRYEPMRDSRGNVIGAWYVGYKLNLKALSRAINEWSFMEHGFIAISDEHQQVRFLTKGITVDDAQSSLKNQNKVWKIISRIVPEWNLIIHILYPLEDAYWASIRTLLPWLVIFLFINLTVMITLGFNLKRFVLNPLGTDPESAKQLLMRIESGNFAEDDTPTPTNSVVAKIVLMRRRLREMLNDMQENAKRLKISSSVFDHAHDAIFITNADGIIIQSNPSFSSLTGYTQEECVGKHPAVLGLSCRDNSVFEQFFAPSSPHEWIGEMWNRHANGNEYLVEIELLRVIDVHGQFQHYVGLFSDITNAKAQRNMLEHLAYHDALTQLPNRVLFSQRLQNALTEADKHASSLAICYFDLDDFKIVNDQHGHDYGDKLLQLLSARILAILNPHDTLARLGGDEFALLLCGGQSMREYKQKLAKLLTLIEKPFIIDELKFSISASIGYTVYPSDNNAPDTLLRHADHAMYYAKTHGGHQFQQFDLASAYQSQHEQTILRDLLQAIQKNEIKLVYQPQVDIHTGQVISFEALLRWQHPQRGLLSPKDFLEMIENTSLIAEIGHWVLEESMRQLDEWNMQGFNTRVSVNIAAYHLMQKHFAGQLVKLFKKYPQVKPIQLHLEITESAAISDFNKVNKVIGQCHALGVTFAIDDFGAGYSSLIYLRRLPVDVIKIDQSFIRNMLNNDEDMAVIRGIITLCREFKRKVVAEGVEYPDQAEVLKKLGCDYAQGYGISKGMYGAKVMDWIQKNQPFQFSA